MLVAFPLIFVVDTEIIYRYNFEAPLKVPVKTFPTSGT